ncbi:MAG: hypothetical protein C0498_10095 [Anaerolinea sp.]|nr:hypothetical protein [Anaerolinea sp.]
MGGSTSWECRSSRVDAVQIEPFGTRAPRHPCGRLTSGGRPSAPEPRQFRSRETVVNEPSAAASVAAPVLSCAGLRKRFGTRQAVDGVGFEIGPGETYGLLGPNGAGKTTTISMVCGILARDRAARRHDGADRDLPGGDADGRAPDAPRLGHGRVPGPSLRECLARGDPA